MSSPLYLFMLTLFFNVFWHRSNILCFFCHSSSKIFLSFCSASYNCASWVSRQLLSLVWYSHICCLGSEGVLLFWVFWFANAFKIEFAKGLWFSTGLIWREKLSLEHLSMKGINRSYLLFSNLTRTHSRELTSNILSWVQLILDFLYF